MVEVHFPLSNCGVRLTNIQLEPAAVDMISNSFVGSKPTFTPRDIASAAAARCTPTITWVTSLNLAAVSAVLLCAVACLNTNVWSPGRYTLVSWASSSKPNPALTPLARTCSVADARNKGNSAALPPAVTIPYRTVSVAIKACSEGTHTISLTMILRAE